MASINKVIIVGNLGADPDIKYMPSGGAVCNVSIATTDTWKDKTTGEKKENTEWHRVVFFNRLAEIVGDYLKKGSQVYVEGALRTRKWQKDGVDMYTTEVVAREMQMLGSAKGGIAEYPKDASGQPQTAAAQAGVSNNSQAPQTFDNYDDDIPF